MVKYYKLHQNSGGLPLVTNRLRELRENRMVSRSELARKARISELTVARIERGNPCRKDTKRKILVALDLIPLDRDKVFPEN